MSLSELKTKAEILLSKFYKGDDTAFSELYDMYVQVLFNYGIRLTSDQELLKDCIHDVFIKVYAKRSENSPINNLSSYLLISLKNRLYDEFRRASFSSEAEMDECHMQRCSDDIEDEYILSEIESMKHQKVISLMDNLTTRQRQAITLYYLEERKYEEICQILNMNYHSVRNLMHRGMIKLREAAK